MELSPRMRHMMDEVTLGSPVARALGITLVSASPERTILRMPFQPANITFEDAVHGGVIATFIDIAAAAGFVAGAPDDMAGGVTSNMSISYLSAARGVDLLAEAHVLRRGKRQIATDVTVTDPSGRLIAKGLVTNRSF